MSQPPPKRPSRDRAAEVLRRLTGLAEQLAGAFRPASVADLVAGALTDALAPDRLSIMLLDVDTNRLVVVHHTGARPPGTDDPLLQLALRRGPLVFRDRVAARAAELGAKPERPEPASWIGVPIVAAGRATGAVSLDAARGDRFGDAELAFVHAVVAQAAIALDNARLVELLSSGKHEWELTVDGIGQAICFVDSQGVVRRANRVFADLLKLPVTALPGRSVLTVLPPAWADPLGRALAQPGTPAVEVKSDDRVFAVNTIPIGPSGAAVLLFDEQTERRRLQEQLLQSEKMSAIGQLIAGVAHDLNNPLASVVGFSDFLAEAGELPPRLTEPLQVIRQEAQRAATIVRNLLSFARRQEGERKVQSIRPILESTLALLRNQLMAHKIEATLEVEAGIPEVEVDANQIKQVFVNIINNAAHAIGGTRRTGGGGRIEVVARCHLDGVAVSFADNGPGIAEAVVQRVFEPFFTTKPEREGTGLGLSICQGIVKEHGGQITVDGGPGTGATFTVELPGGTRGWVSRPVAPEAASEPSPREAPPPSEHLRILIVDDEPHILHYMKATLESWGHSVELARDGSQALKRALTQPFDLIICDLRMPRLGGREMYQTLAKMHPAVAERIVFATGDTVRGDTLQFLEELGRPYLHKPFTLAELRRVLDGRIRPST